MAGLPLKLRKHLRGLMRLVLRNPNLSNNCLRMYLQRVLRLLLWNRFYQRNFQEGSRSYRPGRAPKDIHARFSNVCYPKTRHRVKKYLAPGISQFYKFYFDINLLRHQQELCEPRGCFGQSYPYTISHLPDINSKINEVNPDNSPGVDWSQLLHMFRVPHHRRVANMGGVLGRTRLILHTLSESQQ